MTPAHCVIKAFGSSAKVAKILGVHRSTVTRWTWPRVRGGSDGNVPWWYHGPLIKAAQQKGVSLSEGDLVRRSENVEAAG